MQTAQGEGGGNGLRDAAGDISSQKAKAEGEEQQEEMLKGGVEGDVLLGPSLTYVHIKHVPSALASSS